MAKVFNLTGGGGDGIRKRLEVLEKTVGGSEAGLVKGVAENTADLTALRSDVSDVQRQQSAHDTAISANTAAAAAAKAAADSAASDASAAAQAAQAAQTAAGSASAAASDALAKANAALPLAGGTMTGPIVRNGDIIHSNRIQVDPGFYFGTLNTYSRALGYLPVFGVDTLERSDTPISGISPIRVSGISTPYFEHDAANKQYVDRVQIVKSLNEKIIQAADYFIGIPCTGPNLGSNNQKPSINIPDGTKLSKKHFSNLFFTTNSQSFDYCVFNNCIIKMTANLAATNCSFVNCVIYGEFDLNITTSFADSAMQFINCYIGATSLTSNIVGSGYATRITFINCKSNITSKPNKISTTTYSFGNNQNWMNSN